MAFYQNAGAAGTPLIRTTYPAYGDGHDKPAGATRPNARIISNSIVFAADQPENDRDMSTLVYIWGQVSSRLDPTAVQWQLQLELELGKSCSGYHFK